MSEQSPENNLDTSMSSSADSHARISAKPESEPDCLAIARAFGLSSPVLLAKFDPDGWLPKMCQGSLLSTEQWEPLSGSWPDSAMWDRTSVYELRSSERPILENESSSWPTWPTPDAQLMNDGADPTNHQARLERLKLKHGNGNGAGTPLAQKAMTWPTARREDGESCGNHPGATDSLTGATRNWNVSHQEQQPTVASMPTDSVTAEPTESDHTRWLTPHGMHGTDHTGKTGRGGEFAKQATQWPTPQACSLNSLRGSGQDPAKRKEGGHSVNLQDAVTVFPSLPALPIPDGPTSSAKDQTSPQPSASTNPRLLTRRLNPRFVEFLMGLPLGWTEVD